LVDIIHMAARPVQISLDRDLLRRIDSDLEAQRKGRSAFIRSAVLYYLADKQRREIDARIRRAYSGKADELLGEVEALLGVQAWPRR
jgi:metal-responsive CopG/Arc/MetJ family transcriptional regulator